jgi:hypothetical protein
MERDAVKIQNVLIHLVRNLGLDLSALELPVDSSHSDTVQSCCNLDGSALSSFKKEHPLNSGDILAVQERFYALLKHRLQSEIQRNPPLFPWEKTVMEYPDTILESGAVADSAAPFQSVWLAQLRQLALPVKLPDSVLTQLLSKCQSLSHSSLREGAKLVKAVEDLFPTDLAALNQLAGMVLVSPGRSGDTTLQSRLSEATGGALPTSYDQAIPTQQMVLSLLAARDIFSALTLQVSSARPTRYEWITDVGVMTLQADYQIHGDRGLLRLQGVLPCGGRMELQHSEECAVAERPNAGPLHLELTHLGLDQSCVLEIQLGENDALRFTLCPEISLSAPSPSTFS